MYRVMTPEAGFNGESCGVTFVNGVAEAVPDGPALRYFRNAGYGVEPLDAPEGGADEAPPELAPDEVPPVGSSANGEGADNGPVKPAGNASTEAWREYAVLKGVPAEEAEAMSRDQIKAKFNENESKEGEEQ